MQMLPTTPDCHDAVASIETFNRYSAFAEEIDVDMKALSSDSHVAVPPEMRVDCSQWPVVSRPIPAIFGAGAVHATAEELPRRPRQATRAGCRAGGHSLVAGHRSGFLSRGGGEAVPTLSHSGGSQPVSGCGEPRHEHLSKAGDAPRARIGRTCGKSVVR